MVLLPQVPVEMQRFWVWMCYRLLPPPKENDKGRASKASRHQHCDSY